MPHRPPAAACPSASGGGVPRRKNSDFLSKPNSSRWAWFLSVPCPLICDMTEKAYSSGGVAGFIAKLQKCLNLPGWLKPSKMPENTLKMPFWWLICPIFEPCQLYDDTVFNPGPAWTPQDLNRRLCFDFPPFAFCWQNSPGFLLLSPALLVYLAWNFRSS